MHIQLNTISLEHTSLQRELRAPLPDSFLEQYTLGHGGIYDKFTLLYDVFLSSQKNKIIAIGPPLLNLKKTLTPIVIKLMNKFYTFKLNGQHKKICIFELQLPFEIKQATPATIILADGSSYPITLRSNSLKPGLSLVTVQKNNKLRWIKYWIQYYTACYNVQNFYIYDNNSDNQQELIQELSGVANVIPWNFPHGIAYKSGNKFCQVGALNHLKLNSLNNTPILNFDIDELLVCKNDRIELEIQKGKYLKFQYYFMPFEQPKNTEYSFNDFTIREKTHRLKAHKYVINSSLEGTMDVHKFHLKKSLSSIWRKDNSKIIDIKDAYFLHYKGITTNWKKHYYDRLTPYDPSSGEYIKDYSVNKVLNNLRRTH